MGVRLPGTFDGLAGKLNTPQSDLHHVGEDLGMLEEKF